MSAARWKPVIAPHSPSRAARAAATAWSMSSVLPSGIAAQGAPAYGSSEPNVRPSEASTNFPAM